MRRGVSSATLAAMHLSGASSSVVWLLEGSPKTKIKTDPAAEAEASPEQVVQTVTPAEDGKPETVQRVSIRD